MLTDAPPSQAKAWAQTHGVPESVIKNPVHHADLDPDVDVDRSPSWLTGSLVEQVRTQLSRQLDDPDRGLLTGELAAVPDVYLDGVNDVRLVTISTGGQGYFKAFNAGEVTFGTATTAGSIGVLQYQQPLHECAASQLAHELGPPWSSMVPGCVLRTFAGQLGSLSRGVEGSLGGPRLERIHVEQRWAAAFFDYLVGQSDRNNSNYLVEGSHLWLIDHGFAFADRASFDGWIPFERQRMETGSMELSRHELATVDRVLASPTTLGLVGVIEPARVEALRERAERMRRTGRLPQIQIS